MNNINEIITIDTKWPYPLPELKQKTKKEKIVLDLRIIFINYFQLWIKAWKNLIYDLLE